LLCYDIRDPGRLRRTHRIAREHGDPLQYSVFVCDLSGAERTTMMDAFRAVVDQQVDTIAVFDLGLTSATKTQMVERLGPQAALPVQAPRIV
jgi:CRISPR-associated protein Cas2